jgi:hypothetical protein
MTHEANKSESRKFVEDEIKCLTVETKETKLSEQVGNNPLFETNWQIDLDESR